MKCIISNEMKVTLKKCHYVRDGLTLKNVINSSGNHVRTSLYQVTSPAWRLLAVNLHSDELY